MDWRHRSACLDEDPELFFPIGNTGPAILQIEEAKQVCRRCDVREQCLAWALEAGQDHGVWGGLSEDERRALKRRNARARVRTAYTLNLLIAAGLTAVAVLSAPAVAAFFRSPGATNLFQVLFGYLLLRGASQVHTAVLQRDLRYRDRTVIDVTRAVVRGGVSVAMALADSGPWAIVIGMLVGGGQLIPSGERASTMWAVHSSVKHTSLHAT